MCEETHYRLCNVVRSYSYWWVNNLFLSLQILWLIRFSYRFQQFSLQLQVYFGVVLLQQLTVFFLEITVFLLRLWVHHDDFIL